MCAVCGDDKDEKKFTSAPGTPERKAEVEKDTVDTIMKHGHQVIGVMGQPRFFYTVGRSVFEKLELIITGNLESRAATSVVNTIARMDADGEIDLAALAGTTTQLDGFECSFKFVEVQAYDCEMYAATNMSGKDLKAIQVVWPDDQGRWPDDPAWDSGDQPIGSIAD